MPTVSVRYPLPDGGDLRTIASLHPSVVSIFVPVTSDVPAQAQNAVRHERAVAKTAARLEAVDFDPPFIQRVESALASFAEEDRSPAHRIQTRVAYVTRHGDLYLYGLPFSEPERIVVGGHAVLRPLIRAAKMFPRFRLLTVSANRVRLYSGDISSLAPLDCEALPESLEDALGTELTEPALQFQSTSGHGRHAGYHGHGGAPRGREIDLERFHQRIARALESGLSDAGPPLILAGDRVHHVGLAKALRRDIGLQQGLVEGNVDNLSESELLDRAVTAVEKTREAPEAALRRIAAQSALVTGAEAVAEQIVMGRVRHLWVGQSEDRLGRLDPMEAAILPPRADEELADELAALTLERGGSVDVLEDPSEWSSDGGFIAALR